MATIVAAPPTLSGELTLFHTTDPLLGNSPVLVFHGAAATVGATSSRIQVHIFTPAGVGSYARLSVSPTSPFYTAVSNLPREEQGDEVCRGLAFGLKKYFVELAEDVKKSWCAQVKAPAAAALFGDDHIAILATRMSQIENVGDVVQDLTQAFGEQKLSWLDVDVVLPPGSIKDVATDMTDDLSESQRLLQKFGRYANIIPCFGEVTFLPTAKVKRAPSKVTAVGRTASFLQHQKENVRKELTELVNTEESYVARLGEMKHLSESLGADLKARYQQQLRTIFPPSIQNILDANSEFLRSIRILLEDTEEAATRDIETTTGLQTSSQQMSQDFAHDTQGIGAMAKCLCDWFPRFADCYKDYLGTHAQASQSLRNVFRQNDTLAVLLQATGEQKLTSLLIEPVQRLPRYTLYIDSITKQLPVRHPALKPLLKARDIITDICAEADSAGAATTAERLGSRTSDWPADIQIIGRLVSAVDYEELAPPYVVQKAGTARGILLLFTDGIVILEKSDKAQLSARALLTEIESGSTPSRSADDFNNELDLKFIRRVRLDAVQCLESHSGEVLQLLTFFELPAGVSPAQQQTLDSYLTLSLETGHDRKAARFIEEVCKARVEHRFSEPERDSGRWEFRGTLQRLDHISLYSAVFDSSNPDYVSTRTGNCAVRIVVDIDKHADRPRAGQNNVRTIVALSPTRDGLWRVTIDSIDGSFGREHVELADLTPNLSRKLAALHGVRLAIDQSAMTAGLLRKNGDVLRSISVQPVAPTGDKDTISAIAPEKYHRPKSPKKLLSNFLSSVGSGSEPPNLLRKEIPTFASASFVSSIPPPPQQKPPSRESRPSSKDHSTPKSFSSTRSVEHLSFAPHRQMEETLRAYILALQARKGNIVGRNIKMRVSADELAVNELYGSLLEDPNMMVLAAQAPVDVLFAAFEKFLHNAWKQEFGPVISLTVLQDIQSKAETLFPADFDSYFRAATAKLAPQNQRAFQSIMRLLADLLDGTGNDGDRGILTAAFAEVLVTNGNPHDYIALIDRFVDDTETYFGETLDEAPKAGDAPTSAHRRARSVNSASLTSNTSSLRRKLGFGTLSRENSKSEAESKVASVWRTLSKSGRADTGMATGSAVSLLGRSHSTDTDSRVTLNSRPSSQDGAKLGPGGDSFLGRTPASSNLGLSTIGEHPSFIPTGPPRKKRRSSLSDLKALQAAQKLEPYSPPSARHPPPVVQRGVEDKTLPNSPVASTPSSKSGSGRFGTPSLGSPRSRLPSSFRREQSPGAHRALATTERPKSSGNASDDVVITARPMSNIPSLTPKALSPQRSPATASIRQGLSERPGAGNTLKEPFTSPEKTSKERGTSATASTGSPKKLRMQSPQKLRERLQTEQSAVAATMSGLQEELSKIGDELTATPSRVASVRTTTSTTPGASMDLARRVLKMEGQVAQQGEELTARIGRVSADLATSLRVSEAKGRKLDELYRDANRENEALYARFNDELARILRAVRAGQGVDELKALLKASQDEAATLRREASRLKRENVGLRAQLRE